jgi:Flagellar assembly protein FliH
MDERMGDGDFVPFVPRKVSNMSAEPSVREQPTDGFSNDEATEATYDVPACDVPSVNDSGPDDKIQTDVVDYDDAVAGIPAATTGELLVSPVADVAPKTCDHDLAIRNEAVRLAAIACGRALRHAVMMHPAVIARFVDDAIEAAGHPHARIRLHPDSVATIVVPDHELIADERLSPGDVMVECDGTSVGATLIERASLLVSAAAG